MVTGKHKREVGVLSLLLLLVACRPVPLSQANLEPVPDAKSALSLLRQRAAKLAGLQAMGRVTYFGESGRIRLKVVLLAQRPSKFRIETLSLFEQPMQVMVSDGKRLSLLADGHFYQGRSTARNVARILPLPLAPTDLVDALLTGVPMDPRYQAESIQWVGDLNEQLRLTLQADALGKIVLDYHAETLTVRRLQLIPQNAQPQVELHFERFENLSALPGLALPRRIKLKLSNEANEVTLKLTEFEVNVGIKPGFFVLSAPAGIAPIDLDVALTSSVSAK